MREHIKTIASKIALGYTDDEIWKEMGISRSTYYNTKAKMYKLYGDIAKKKTEESLEFEAAMLKDRYIRLFRRVEAGTLEAAEAEAAASIATGIFRLEFEGLKARQAIKGLKEVAVEEDGDGVEQQKEVSGYLRDVSTRISEPDYTPTPDDDEQIGDPTEESEESRTTETDAESKEPII